MQQRERRRDIDIAQWTAFSISKSVAPIQNNKKAAAHADCEIRNLPNIIYAANPTDHFPMSEPQNPPKDISEPHQVRQSPDFKASRPWNIRSGNWLWNVAQDLSAS